MVDTRTHLCTLTMYCIHSQRYIDMIATREQSTSRPRSIYTRKNSIYRKIAINQLKFGLVEMCGELTLQTRAYLFIMCVSKWARKRIHEEIVMLYMTAHWIWCWCDNIKYLFFNTFIIFKSILALTFSFLSFLFFYKNSDCYNLATAVNVFMWNHGSSWIII